MDGAELSRTSHALRPSLPVIIVTVYEDQDILKDFNGARVLRKGSVSFRALASEPGEVVDPFRRHCQVNRVWSTAAARATMAG
jgi:hypothetical protein